MKFWKLWSKPAHQDSDNIKSSPKYSSSKKQTHFRLAWLGLAVLLAVTTIGAWALRPIPPLAVVAYSAPGADSAGRTPAPPHDWRSHIESPSSAASTDPEQRFPGSETLTSTHESNPAVSVPGPASAGPSIPAVSIPAVSPLGISATGAESANALADPEATTAAFEFDPLGDIAVTSSVADGASAEPDPHATGTNFAEPAPQIFDTIVVCPRPWQTQLEPWLAYRTAQGRSIGLVDTPHNAQQLKDLLSGQYLLGLKYVLLVGDVPNRFALERNGIPAGEIDSEVSRRFGGPAQVASDNWYADMDGDHAPDLAIGRWSVDDAQQVADIAAKTIRFETEPDPDFAQKRIEFVAGVGDFGFLEDKVIENTATRLLTDLIPRQFQVNMTHASWRSVYCPGPDCFQEQFFASLNRGALFWVYMGHGARWGLDSARFPDREISTVTTRDSEKLSGNAPSIALLLACSTGEFANRRDCLAETMVAAPAGPVAVLAGSGVTAPYGLASMGYEMLVQYRDENPQELGVWLQQAKRRMVLTAAAENRQPLQEEFQRRSAEQSQTEIENNLEPVSGPDRWADESPAIDYRKMLRNLALWFSPTADMLQQEVNEHAEMMTLFGDPLLRLPQFAEIQLAAQTEATPQDEPWLIVSGTMTGSDASHVTLELVHPLDQMPFRAKTRPKYKADTKFSDTLLADYQRANDRVIQRLIVPCVNGSFTVKAARLKDLPEQIWIRASADAHQNQARSGPQIANDPPGDQTVETLALDLKPTHPTPTPSPTPPRHASAILGRALGVCEVKIHGGIVNQRLPTPTVTPVSFALPASENSGPRETENQSESQLPEAAQEQEQKPEQEQEQEQEQPERSMDDLIGEDDEFQVLGKPFELFDKQSLTGWKLTNFGGEREVEVADGLMKLSLGDPLTGITFQGNKALPVSDLPTENYEIQVRAKKVEGGDFFCGLTFMVGQQPCSFIVGGWGGTTVGLSSIDQKDAARNETRRLKKFETDRWYLIRVRVTAEKIQCWIDQEKMVEQTREGHEFSVRPEVRLSLPLGMSAFQTTAQVSDLRLVKLQRKQADGE